MANTWYPTPRSVHTGHRVADQLGYVPVRTREYPWWPWWFIELFMRIAARKIGKGKVPERLVRGVEPKPGWDDYEIGYRQQ